MSTQKNLSIETLRGIAILLVVMGHVIGSAPDGGMKIDFPHPLRYLYLYIAPFQTPLFTAIAGYVYAIRPFTGTVKISTFLRKKAIRLLLPMAVVGTLYFLIQYFTPGTNNKGNLSEIWRIYVFPYTIYWYLPSLFLMIWVQAVVDRRRWMETPVHWGMWCILALVLSQVNNIGFMHDIPNLFSFKGALNRLLYLFVGVGIYRFAAEYRSWHGKWILGLVAAFGVALIHLIWCYSDNPITVSQPLYPLTLIPIFFLLFSMKWHHRFFIWIGGYAYSIYLFHGFGTSGGRIVLKALGVKAVSVIFVVATVIAAVCPIVVDKVVQRFRWSRFLFLGKR